MSYTPCSPLKGAKSIDSEEILVTAWRDGEKSSDQDSLTYLEGYEKVGDSMRDRAQIGAEEFSRRVDAQECNTISLVHSDRLLRSDNERHTDACLAVFNLRGQIDLSELTVEVSRHIQRATHLG